jgi:uncharacterized membrane protein
MTVEASNKPTGRSARIWLMVSLALNVLFIGGFASAFVMHHHGHHGRKESGLMAFARTLPAERKDMIKQKIAGEQSNMASLNKAEHEARTAARNILLEEPFDKDKFKTALDKAVDADAQTKHARMALLASATSDLTPAERKQLHDWIEKHRPLPPLREEPDAKAAQ